MSCKCCGREVPEGQEYCSECLFAMLPVIKKRKKRALPIIAGVIAIALGIIIIFVSFVSSSRTSVPTHSPELSAQIIVNKINPEPLVTSISEVVTAYSKYDPKADLTYCGRLLQFTGCVFEVNTDSSKDTRLTLYEKNHDTLYSLYAYVRFPEDLNFQPGDIITVEGRFDKRIYSSYSDLTLYDCVIVPDPAES